MKVYMRCSGQHGPEYYLTGDEGQDLGQITGPAKADVTRQVHNLMIEGVPLVSETERPLDAIWRKIEESQL